MINNCLFFFIYFFFLQMPRPKKRSAIAKRLYTQKCATTEAAQLPLKTSEAEVSPLPRKKMADLSGSADKCRRANQQVLLRPAIKRVEAAQLPLKTSEAEVLPLPRKKMADLSGSADKCRRANQQVLLRPAIKRVEAAPLPLKSSEAEVSPLPRKKMADHECLYSWSEPSNLEKSLRFPSVSKVVPSVSKVVPSVSKVVPSVSKMFSEKSLKSPEQSLTSSRKSAERFVVPTMLNENVLNTLNMCVDFPKKSVLKGSFHQADARFGASRNRQCGAIGLTAVLKSKMKDVLTWTAQDLDSVLVAGTHLYESLRNQGNIKDRQVKGRNYIAVHELPRRHVLGNTAFSMEYTPSLTGFVNVNDYSEYDEAISGVAMPLDVALQQALLSADGLLLTICANTSAVIKQGSWYAVVDSHAIKTDTSCVVYHSTVESLYNYIDDTAQVFGEPEPPFEITGVLVHADVDVFDPLEEASSSSFPCSSGKALYSEVLKRTRKVCEPVKTEVRTSDYRVPVDKVAHTNLPTQTACNMLPSKGKRGRKRKQNELSDKQVIKSHAETVVTDDITITGVLFHADAEVSDPLEEAGSSSFPYSSGKALYNEVLKHTPKVYKSVKTEVRPADYRVPVDEVVNTRSTNLPTQTAGNVLPSKGKRGRKRKQNELSDKQVIKSHPETVVTDDIIITDVSVPDVFFSPLTPNDRQALCGLLLLTNVNTDCNVINFGPIADPCQTKTIKPDGNCFFRSLAHVICGSEDEHLKIRRAAVKHLKINTSLFERYVRSEYSSVEDYLTRSRMFYSGTWVTEIDIFVSADLFKTTIMTFNDGRWNAHKPTGEVFTQNVIYLKHCNGNHYEVVTCVKHRDRDGVCAGACGHAVSNEVSKPCLRKRKVSDAAECPSTKRHRERYCNDSEYRQKQLKYKKAKYGNDPDYRNTNRNCSKDYYASNVQFQKLVCLYSQVKYKSDVVFQGRVREYSKLKYRQNLAFKARVGKYSKTKYLQNLAFKARVGEYSKNKYLLNLAFKARVGEYSKNKYLQNLAFKARVGEYSKNKYLQNLAFKARVGEYSKKKYLQNRAFKARVGEYSKTKYLQNLAFKARVGEYSKKKYLQNLAFKSTVREYSVMKYHKDVNFRASTIQKGCEIYARKKEQKDIDVAIDYFRQEVNTGPEFVCSVCHRLLSESRLLNAKRNVMKTEEKKLLLWVEDVSQLNMCMFVMTSVTCLLLIPQGANYGFV